jgi:hypothetical protein
MIRHVLTTLCFVHVSSILDHIEIYASGRKFLPLITMHVHDMIRHVLTTLCFVHVSSILDHIEIYASVGKFLPLIAMYVHDMIIQKETQKPNRPINSRTGSEQMQYIYMSVDAPSLRVRNSERTVFFKNLFQATLDVRGSRFERNPGRSEQGKPWRGPLP